MVKILAIFTFIIFCGYVHSITIDCRVQGLVNGIILKSEPAESYDDCLQNCIDNNYCEVFTYHDTRKDCAHFLNATSFDDTCTDCLSGNRECPFSVPTSCQVVGNCIGDLVTVIPKNSEGECLQSCKLEDRCNWYAYEGQEGDCILLENCLFMDTSCVECSSGEKQCVLGEKSDHNTLMVVGGYTGTSIANVELVDLSSGRRCQQPAYLPLALNGMVGTFLNGKAMACGGYIDFQYQTQCYEYDEIANIWSIGPSLLRGRRSAASSNINDTHWLVTGGMDEATSELYDSEQGLFSTSFDLYGDYIYGHYQVVVNASKIVVTGGAEETRDVYSYSVNDKSASSFPDLKTRRLFAPTGLITYENQTQAIVVVGGRESTCEIFSLATQRWQTGPNFPYEITSSGVVQYQNTFLLVGGYNESGYIDTIWKYDVENDDWLLLPQTMQESKSVNIAFLVPDSYC